MTGLPVIHNKRKAKCADCKSILQKGEGIGEKYPMFHGNGQHFYLCPPCKKLRVERDEKFRLEQDKKSTLIPKPVMDEFKKRMQESRGYDAKRSEARRFVYLTIVGRMGAHYWNEHREKLLNEIEVAEKSLQAKSGDQPVGMG